MSSTSTHRPPRAAAAVGIVILMSAAACAAYWQLYSSFARYDDEGYVLLSLRMFQTGHPLYDETATQYGPAYYFVQDALHRLLRLPVTHDIARAKTLLVWLATAVCFAVLTRRVTGRSVLAVAAGLGTMWHLDRLGLEPGHPQDQSLLLLDALLLLAGSLSTRGGGASPCLWLTGVIVGTLLMTKLNLGVLTGLAVGGILVLDMPAGAARHWLWRGCLASGMALPLVLAGNHVASLEGAALPLVVVLGWAAFSAASSNGVPEVGPHGRSGVRGLCAFAAATIAAATTFLMAAWWDGTSSAGLWHGLIGQHRGFLDLFYHHPPLPEIAPLAGFCGLGLAVWSRRDARAVTAAQWMSLGLLLLTGLQAFGDVFRPVTHGLDDRAAAGWLAGCAPGISWALLAGEGHPATRRLLCLLTLVGPLGAYPTPGTQLAVGTLPALLAMYVLTGDLTVRLAAASPATLPVVRKSICGLALMSIVTLACRDVSAFRCWSANEPLNLPGAARLRLPSEEAASRRAAVAYLRDRADAFAAAPTGCCSFYLWTGIAPPTTRNVTFWEVQLGALEQRAVVAALDAASHPCVLIDRGQSPVQYLDAPLHRYLTERFTQRVVAGRFEVCTPGAPAADVPAVTTASRESSPAYTGL